MNMEIIGLLGKDGVLTVDEENRVFSYFRQAGEPLELRNMIIEKNLGLCRVMASKYSNMGVDVEELVQEGVFGLARAVSDFDETKGTKFSTYAGFWIRQAVTRYIANHGRTIRLPVHMMEFLRKLKKVQNAYEKEYGELPSDEQTAEALGCSVDAVHQALAVSRNTVSMDTRITADGGDDLRLGDILEDPKTSCFSESVEESIDSDTLHQIVNTLGDREREVIRMRFGLDGSAPMTLEEVGLIMGVTRERIRQLEQKALGKLRVRGRRLQGIY